MSESERAKLVWEIRQRLADVGALQDTLFDALDALNEHRPKLRLIKGGLAHSSEVPPANHG